MPFDRTDQGRLFPAYKGPGSLEKNHFKIEGRPQNPLSQKAVFLCLADGPGNHFYGKRVFCPYIDDGLPGADGIGANGNPFKHLMGVTLQDGPVHVSAGISLVSVADNRFFRADGLFCQIPFRAGWETRPSPAPETGVCDAPDNLFPVHLKGFGQSMVTA